MTNRALIERLAGRVTILELEVEALKERAGEGDSVRPTGIVEDRDMPKTHAGAPNPVVEKKEKVRGPWIALPNVDLKPEIRNKISAPIAFKQYGKEEVALDGTWKGLMRKVIEGYAMTEERRSYLLQGWSRHDTMKKILEVVGDNKYLFSVAFAVEATE